jgi:hypothetical protein
MRGLAVVLSLALASGVYGQAIRRSFGSVVFPGGTSATSPTITRNFGSVVFPGGVATPPINTGGPSFGFTRGSTVFNGFNGSFFPSNGVVNSRNGRGLGVNGRRGGGGGGRNNGTPYVFAYPVFIGGGYDDSYAMPQPELPMQPPQQQPQQPNVTVVFPPQQQQQRANPTMIQPGPDGDYPITQRQQGTIYEAPRDTNDPANGADSGHYLVAFKDHTIYSAVAYWVDGETLHYFTTGNIHNQASISLIDRELTNRLNRELGLDFKLPPAK